MTEVAGVASQEALARPVIWQRERAVRLASAGLFILRRLAFGVVILLAIAFLSFLGLEMARGTDFRPAVGYAAASTVAYMGQLVQGNLGYTQPGTVASCPCRSRRSWGLRWPRAWACWDSPC